MKRYLKNVVMALAGRNPYREDLDELKEKYEKAGENVKSLRGMYCNAVERWTEADKQAKSLQTLVENLRERIREKDAGLEEQGRAFRELLEQTRREYDKRIATYAEEIARMKEQ
jgi:chromosome segregation ATPase